MADGQVFRIEIPVEVRATGGGELAQIQANLERTSTALQRIASTGGSAFSQIASGASSAASSLSQIDSAASSASSSVQGAGSEAASAMDRTGDAAQDAADSMEDVGEAAQDAGNEAKGSFDGADAGVDRFTQRVEQSQKTLRQMFAEKFQLVMEALDKASPALNNIKNTLKGIVGKAWQITVKMADFVTAPFRKILSLITSPVTMALSFAGLSMGASSFIDTYKSFEAGMSNVRALSGATGEDFDKLKAKASELGATTKFTATEAAEGMQYLAMAGWDTSEIIEGMPGLLQLAAAGSTDLGTAADIVSDVMTAMGMSADEASRAADVFAKTATSTNTTISMMGETLKYAAPIAHSFGLELEQVSAITGMMANAGIKGSQAGTAIRSSLLRMAAPPADAAKAMSKLNLSFADSTGKMKDMGTIIKELQTSFAGLSQQEKLAYADDIFGKTASSAWLAVIDQGSAAYDELYKSLMNCEGAAQEMADIQLDNLQGDITLLQSAVDGMKISLMDKLNPFLRKGVQWITDQIPNITERLGGLIDTVIEKATGLKEHIEGVFNSAEFKNADSIADKLFIAWDKIIAEPFSQWWNGSGKETIIGIVRSIGDNLGQVYHGIIAGIIAALKGEEIDADGMNLTGMAAAGAETAKTFVTSFTNAFDLSGLFHDLPGIVKAGLLGFGGLKLGGTALSLAKDFGMIRLAFKGVGLTAGAAAGETAALGATATNTVGILGGLKSLVAAVPVWGWVAAAAIAAVVVGINLYNKRIQQQKEELWALGDAVEETTQQYSNTAQTVNKTIKDLDSLNRERHQIEYILWVNRVGLTDEEIDNVKKKIGNLDTEIQTVIFNIVQHGNLTAEEAVEVANQLATIKSDKKTVLASIISIGNTEKGKEVYDLIQQYELAGITGDTEKQAKLRAQIIAKCEPGKAEETLELLKKFDEEELDPLQAAMVIAQILANTGGNADAEAVLSLLERYKNAKLAAVTMSNVIATISATMPDGDKAAKVLELLKDYDSAELPALIAAFAAAGINVNGDTAEGEAMLTLLENYDTADLPFIIATLAKAGINVNGDTEEGAAMLSLLEQYDEAGLPALLAILTLAGVNISGDTETGDAMLKLLKRYKEAQLTSEKIDIEAELDAICTDPAMKALYLPLFEKYAGLESNEADIVATLDASGVSEEEIALLQQLADLIAERDQLTLILEAGGLSEDELETYKERYSEILDEITALTNGAVDAHNLEGAAIDANIAKLEQQLEIERELDRLRQQRSLQELERQMPEVIEGEQHSREKEAEIQTAIDAANAVPSTVRDLQIAYNQLEVERGNKLREAEQTGNYQSYVDYMKGAGGYIEQARQIYTDYGVATAGQGADEEQVRAGANATFDQHAANLEQGLFQGGWSEGGLDAVLSTPFDQLMQGFVDSVQPRVADLESQLSAQQAETAKYTNERMQYYTGSEISQTGQNFKGTEYEGMSLSEIAGHYSEFANNPMMVSAFEHSVEALNELNRSMVENGWATQDELTSVDAINAIKDASFANVPTQTTTNEVGETVSLINTDQAYAKLQSQNVLAWNNGSNDTKFTRDLKANEEAYKAAQSATYGSDAEKEAAINAVLAERTAIMTEQQTAIRTGIEGVQQLDTQITAKQAEIGAAQTAMYEKDYSGTIDQINQLQQAYEDSFISGGQEGQEAFAGTEEAAASLEAINAQLEGMGLDKISSLTELGAALEAVNGAKSADESAIAQLRDELAGLEASQIELLVAASNAMDSLNWNTGRLADSSLDDSLKIDTSTASNIETLNTDLQKASELLTGVNGSASTASGGLDGASGSAASASGTIGSLRDNVSTAKAELESLAGTYEVRVNYIFNVPQTPSLPTGAVKRANGGFVDSAQLSIIGEDGPEAVIPLGAKRRNRGLDLWLEAGRALGVNEFAEGGIAAPYAQIVETLPDDTWIEDSDESISTVPAPVNIGNMGGTGTQTVDVNVSANPVFQINGGEASDILDQLKEKQKELAELLGASIAEQMQDIVLNMV